MKNFNKVKTTQLIEHTFCHSDVSMEENIYFFIFKDVDRASTQFCFVFFSRIYFFILEREMEGEREGEKHQCVVASCAPPTGDLPRNSDMCPGWESNWQPFDSQARTQSTQPHQPWLKKIF